MKMSFKKSWMPFSTIVLIVGGFVFDMITPRGVADWIIYFAPIVLSSRFGPTWLPFGVAASCSVLMVIGFLLSAQGVSLGIAIVNRALAFVAMWLAAFVSRRGRLYERALIESAEQLRHEDRLKTLGRLASGVAHELGTPLNVVSGTADFILSGGLSLEEVRENAVVIRDQAKRMSSIIQQLLHFARRRAPSRLNTDLRDVVRQTLDFMGPFGKKQNVTMLSSVDDTPVIARVDATQIQQVLSNLILNAVQAMPNGGNVEVGVCRVTAAPPENVNRTPGEYACIFVVDEGEGIAQENVTHLFEPFFTTKDIGQGTGLGLSIAYGIITEHRGWIEVKSEPGKGSCFSVYLPTED